jgi:hypothetical protein
MFGGAAHSASLPDLPASLKLRRPNGRVPGEALGVAGIRQSIFFERLLRRLMDTRVKPAYDAYDYFW